MRIAAQAVHYGQRRLTRRLMRTVPFLGAVVALITVGSAMKRKGLLKGALDTALNFTPFVGGVKNAMELLRGRDFIADKQP